MSGKIKKREVPRIQYYVYCPECQKIGLPLDKCEIKGNSPSQVKYALEVHLKQKHKKGIKNGRNKK